jgi:hypothetical protein
MANAKWRKHEADIYTRLKDWAGEQAEVRFDQTLPGRFSQADRQVDVLITGRFAGVTDRDISAAVDCGRYKRELRVKHVDAFIGLVEDVQADLGLLLSTRPATSAAVARGHRGRKLYVISETAPAPVLVANPDQLPALYAPGGNESYYVSEYYEGGYISRDGAAISYRYIEAGGHNGAARMEHGPAWRDEPVAAGSEDELSWGDDGARAGCARAILRHRNSGAEPPEAHVSTLVEQLAQDWEDGQPWVLYDGELTACGL